MKQVPIRSRAFIFNSGYLLIFNYLEKADVSVGGTFSQNRRGGTLKKTGIQLKTFKILNSLQVLTN